MNNAPTTEKKRGFGRFVTRLFPSYSLIPIVFWAIFNFAAYYGVRAINVGRTHYDLSIPLDDIIPFFSPAIIVYILWYIQIAAGMILIVRESREVCFRVFSGEIIAKIFSAAVFLIVPTVMVRPEIDSDGFCELLTRGIYAADTPDNLFPSLHCLESWLWFRGLMKCKKVPKGFTVGFGVFSVLVFASVVLVKQHLFVDIPAGILLAELGLLLSKKLGAERVFEKLDRAIFLRKKEVRSSEG